MTPLYMVIKVHAESCGHDDSQRKKLNLSSLVDLSRGLFSAEDIGEMECNMLSRLSWRRQVNPITPSSLVALEFASFVEGALLAMCGHMNYMATWILRESRMWSN